MSRKWNKSFSWVILVSFILLLLPKSLVHDCNHGNHTQSKEHPVGSKTTIQQDVEKCAICDLHIPLLTTPLENHTAGIRYFIEKIAVSAPETPLFASTFVRTLRGPPSLMM